MPKFNYSLSSFIVYCILFIGGLYEMLLSGNFSSYSTSGKIKSIIVMALIDIAIVFYFFETKPKVRNSVFNNFRLKK